MSDWLTANLRHRAHYDAICAAERGATPAARTLMVEDVDLSLGEAGRAHAVLTARTEGRADTVHLWTSDPDFIALLVPGAAAVLQVESAGAPNRRCASCRWLSDETAFRDDPVHRECTNPKLRAEPMAEPGACFGGVAVEPTFGCVQWDAKPARG